MIAYELISKSLSPLHLSDTGEQALTMMSIFNVKHLPIVKDGQFLGLISDDEIMSKDLELSIQTYNVENYGIAVKDKDHLFEVIGKIAEHKLTVIPVLDEENFYLGMITQEDLLQYYANSFSFKERGSILVLETSRIDYSLAEISRIVESESGSILSSFLTSPEDTEQVFVTIKLAEQNIQQIIAAFERYEYKIRNSFLEEEFIDTLKERYDALMSYLNV